MNLPYTLACVHWYKVHLHARFSFGLPIQACLPSFEDESVAAFIPVMRIDSVCGVAELSYNLGTANGKEKIVVAVPLDLKSHVGILKAIRTFKTNLKQLEQLKLNFYFLGSVMPCKG